MMNPGSPLLAIAGLVFLFLLAALSWLAISRVFGRFNLRLLGGAVLFWSNLVVTGHIAALFHALNNPIIYITISFAFAGLILFLGWKSKPPFRDRLEPHDNDNQGRKLIIVLCSALTLAGLASVILAVAILPTNFDSLMYRFPRVYWYVDAGTLLHQGSPDLRTGFYPLNGVLLYAPIALFRLPAALFTLYSVASWVAVVLGSYEISRQLHCSKRAAWIAASLIGLSPNVFAQATSTNDEILSAAALVCGLCFCVVGWRIRRWICYLLAGAAFGLSFGTKLHFFFLLWMAPFVCAALVFIAIRAGKAAFFNLKPHILPAICGIFLAGILSVPFFFWNRASSDEWFLKSELMIKPMDVSVGFQNFALHLGQLLLSPIPDIIPLSNSAARPYYIALNKVVDPLFSWRSDEPKYWFSGYSFKGTVPENHHIYYSEETICHGFVPYLLTLGILALLPRWRDPRLMLALLCGISFWVYYISVTFQTRYFTSLGVYLTYALASTGLLFACFADAPFGKWMGRLRWALIGFVLLTNGIYLVNLCHKNAMRNFGMLAMRLPADRSNPDGELLQKLGGLSRIHAVYTHWAVPYFNIIQRAPHALHTSSSVPDPNPLVTNLYAVQENPFWGFLPMQLTGAATGGLVKDGTLSSAYGREGIYSDPLPSETNKPRFVLLEWKKTPAEDLQIMAKFPGRGNEGINASYRLLRNGVPVDEISGPADKWLDLKGFASDAQKEYQIQATLSKDGGPITESKVFSIGSRR